MAIVPGDFLSTAQRLLSPAASESDLRSAVSRAYYALYQTMRVEVLKIPVSAREGIGMGQKSTIPHERLCMSLKNCAATRRIGVELDLLRDARLRADYDIERTVSYARAKEHVDAAQETLEYISTTNLSSTMDAFRAYLSK